MLIGGKNYPPPFEFWVPDYTDFKLPFKPTGEFYLDTEDYPDYLNWLVVYLEKNKFLPNKHHREILSDPVIKDFDAERLGLWFGAASISQFYFFADPLHDYPPDFLDNPRPERVCDPSTANWESSYFNPDSDDSKEYEGMIDLETYLIFDCMCWNASMEYEIKRSCYPADALFSDLGWRPLLKEAISRTDNWWEKKKAISAFHKEYSYLAGK